MLTSSDFDEIFRDFADAVGWSFLSWGLLPRILVPIAKLENIFEFSEGDFLKKKISHTKTHSKNPF
jgi:hypothetical protein